MRLFLLLIASIFLISCEKDIVRRDFVERSIPVERDSIHLHSASEDFQSKLSLKWLTPYNWAEIPGSDLRLATFKIDTATECSIVSLPGDAGGIRANISRWAGQLNLKLTDNQLSELISQKKEFKSKGNLSIKLIDFSPFISSDQDPSMMAAIINTTDNTLFVKITGPKSVLITNRDKFVSLCTSLYY